MKYTAFISYNSKDDKWARWLQRKLESYSMPTVIYNEKHEIVDRECKEGKMKVFRYKSDLNTISLQKGLAQELDQSQWLIVICSPHSAQSEWVGREIQHFISTGRADHILPFIISGSPYSADENECFNPVLKQVFPPGDILGVNINDYGDDPWIYRKRKALIRTISLLIEVPDSYAYLWNRYRIRYWEGVALKTLAFLLVVVTIIWALNRNTPFQVKVSLKELSPINRELPPTDSFCISLMLDNEVKTRTLASIEESAVFKNIPGKFRKTEVKVNVSAYAYDTIDTLVRIEPDGNVWLPIKRDGTYGVLEGIVYSYDGKPVYQAEINAEGCTAHTDREGKFSLHIPVEKQKKYPKVVVSKNGYHPETFTEQSVGRNWQIALEKQ